MYWRFSLKYSTMYGFRKYASYSGWVNYRKGGFFVVSLDAVVSIVFRPSFTLRRLLVILYMVKVLKSCGAVRPTP
jgi:hypothetical protein